MGRTGMPGGPETIGALIARVRGEAGVSQLRLAQRLCASAGVATVTRHEISRWEREERLPSPYWLAWLAEVLECRVERLERAVAASRAARTATGWGESLREVAS